MKVTILVVALLGIVACTVARTLNNDDLIWEAYKMKFDKVYKDESEDQLRKMIFEENLKIINDHNERWQSGDETYEMGLTEFSDMLDKEFSETLGTDDDMDEDEDMDEEIQSGDETYKMGLTKFSDVLDKEFSENLVADDDMDEDEDEDEDMNEENQSIDDFYNKYNLQRLPFSVNWTRDGAVSPVVNQGNFNNSWAFAAAGAVESRNFLRTLRRVILSKQNLIDCSNAKDAVNAFNYIKNQGGIDTERSYRYRGAKHRKCAFKKKNIGARIYGVHNVPRGNETALAWNVVDGPVSAVISYSAIKNYKRGVYQTPCRGGLEFSVLVVGFGNDRGVGAYWILKTPLGTKWGENGYMRLARNKNNLCGIANKAVVPLV